MLSSKFKTTRDRRARKDFKFSLIKRLYEQNRNRQDIINFYGLLDWMMTMPEELEAEFNQQLTQYEEEMKMPYITSIERIGEQRGEQRGELLEAQKLVIKLLNRRIGEFKPPVIEQIRKLPIEQLEELAEALLDFSTVANLEEWLKARPIF